MPKSLWIKFLVLLLAVSFISLSAAFFLRELIIRDFRDYLEGEMEDRVYRVMASIEGSYEKYSGWKEDALKEDTIWALMLGYEVKILDINNKEIMNTDKAVGSLSPLMKRRVIAISGFPVGEDSSTKNTFTVYPLFLGGKEIGRIETRFIGLKRDPLKEVIFIKRSNRFLLFSLFGLGGLAVILSFIFSRKLTNPIKKLTSAARAISEGNIRSRVSIHEGDEISELAKAFNTMAGNLEIQESLRKKLRSNIAHELRTPLSAMQAELEGMIDGLMAVDRERLMSLYEETGRLKKIIEGMEELSKAEASALEIRREMITLNPFLGNIMERFEKLFTDKGIKFRLECDDKITLYADPDKFSQIIINLLSNSLKATAGEGAVTVRARKVAESTMQDAGYKMHDKDIMDRESGIMHPDRDFIEISVEDTGTGIKEEDLPVVFERFYKATEGGLGIGLTIAKELAEAHGGRIELKSEYGKGSTFTLYIPSG
ncbi:MAG: HAMP domain-containing histidine kinase [Nitrospirae bacterium]|nr:HAMP domain-containing histidine kinase [Nitrospirota bacterium]